MASIKDVAKLAGVSISTVSRVINDSNDVDEKTRAIVKDVIYRINYRPNLLAAGLRSKSGNLIGLVVPEIAHQSFSEFIKFTEKYVHEKNRGLILGNTSNDPDIEANFIDQLIRRNVDGIIFIRISDTSRALTLLKRTSIPFVVLDRGSDRGHYPSVLMDNIGAGRIAARHLIGLGHTKVACVTGPQDLALCRDRLKGFSRELHSAGIELRQEQIFEGDFKFSAGISAFDQFRSNNPEITGIWAQNDLMAMGVIARAADAGVRVPRELSVFGVDNINSCDMIRPRLTTIAQPFREMSRVAVEMLTDDPGAADQQPRHITVPVEMVVRDSTAPRPSP